MKILIILIMAATPIIEQKAAIPFAIASGYSNLEAFLITLVGALLPAPIILLFLPKVFKLMREKNILVSFVDWYEKRALDKGSNIVKYELLGLLLFVAIPLPMTGVWTGSAVAAMIGLDFKKAFPTVIVGATICGGIIMLVVNGVLMIPFLMK